MVLMVNGYSGKSCGRAWRGVRVVQVGRVGKTCLRVKWFHASLPEYKNKVQNYNKNIEIVFYIEL